MWVSGDFVTLHQATGRPLDPQSSFARAYAKRIARNELLRKQAA
jgi:hypothetical protein